MTKRETQAAEGATPAADKVKAPAVAKVKADGQIKIVADGRLLTYRKPLHIVRTLSDRGGPWSESVVAVSVANETLSKMLQGGLDLLYAQRVQMTTEGLSFMWLLAEPVGHGGKGLSQIKHVTRTIMPGLSATPPAMSAPSLNAYIDEFLNEGFMVFNFMPLGMEPGGGVAAFWVLVK